jgi:hypothetical protein
MRIIPSKLRTFMIIGALSRESFGSYISSNPFMAKEDLHNWLSRGDSVESGSLAL